MPSVMNALRPARAWMLALLLLLVQALPAANNPDPCPSDEDCSAWVCEQQPNLTCTYESGPYRVCPSTSTASWTIATGSSQGWRSFTVPGRDDCDKRHYYGLKDVTWTWTITGPAGFAAQSGGGTTATLANARPSIPGDYTVAWIGTAMPDDACCTGPQVSTSYFWSFTIPAPSGTAAATPAEQTVCLHPDMVVVDLLGDAVIERTVTFAFTPTEDGCSHNIRWQLSGGDGLGLQAPLSGDGMTATAKLRIPINTMNMERTITCIFSSEDTGADLATATAKVKVVNAAWQNVPPQLTVAPKPPNKATIQACLAFTGDFDPRAQMVNGSDDLVCPDGQIIRSEPIALVFSSQMWSGAGGLGFGATRHVVLNGPGNYTVTCRIFALFFGARSGFIMKQETVTWKIKVNKVDLLRRPTLAWVDPPSLRPNPAAPGELVEVLGSAKSTPGLKICRPNPVAPIAVTPATVRFELPPGLDPLDPDLWLEDGKIRVGANAKGAYPIKVIAEAHIIDPADVALCGGDLQPLEQAVTLQVPAPKARISLGDAYASPDSTVNLPWVLTNTGSAPDTYTFVFSVTPERNGDAKQFALEVIGWSYDIDHVPDSNQIGLGSSGSVRLARGQTARGSVAVRVYNGVWGDSGKANVEVLARSTTVAMDSGFVRLPTPTVTMREKRIAAGGIAASPHTTEVIFSWSGAPTFSGTMMVQLVGGAGADNSGIWWWTMGAVPAQLHLVANNQVEIIKAGDTKAIVVNGTKSGILVSSNKVETATIRIEGGVPRDASFMPGSFTIQHESIDGSDQSNMYPVNQWKKVFVSKSLNENVITGHHVRLVVRSVTLIDGRTLRSRLGSNEATSVDLTQYIWLDQDGIIDHRYQDGTLGNQPTQFEVMVRSFEVESFALEAFDYSVTVE